MNKEIEIDFLEPSLAIMITNLEVIEYAFENEKKQNIRLSDLLDKLNEVEELEHLRVFIKQLHDLKVELKKEILTLKTQDTFELITALQTTISISHFLSEEEFLFGHIENIQKMIEQNEIKDEYQIFENYKSLIIEKINDINAQTLLDFQKSFDDKNELIMVLKATNNETDLNNLREASKILINILKINFDFNDKSSIIHLTSLISVDVLINLIDLWSEFELEEE